MLIARHYFVHLKKSGNRVPKVELEEMGPRFDFAMRRVRFADKQLRKGRLLVCELFIMHMCITRCCCLRALTLFRLR